MRSFSPQDAFDGLLKIGRTDLSSTDRRAKTAARIADFNLAVDEAVALRIPASASAADAPEQLQQLLQTALDAGKTMPSRPPNSGEVEVFRHALELLKPVR